MSGRDTSNPELLSAYLDGELSSEERHEVERQLEGNDELRQLLGQFRQLSDDLQLLPRYHLDEPVYERIVGEIERLSQAVAADGREQPFSDELISAYLDGELPDADRQRVQRQLEASAEHRHLLGELRDLQDSLQSLPTYQLDEGFAERVVRRAERETLLGSETDATQVTTALKPASVGRQSRWRVYVWAAVTVAGLVALALSLPRGSHDGDLNLADPGTKTETIEVVPDDRPDVLPQEDSRALVEVDTDAETDGQKVTPQSPVEIKQSTQLQLVSSIQRSSRQRLILVYELSVTPEGVDNAAFANLLKRHQIRFRQTASVSEKQQKSLLKHRFLQGVQVASDEADNMDEVQLYLLSCSGRDADAMYFDLMSRPVGIGSFCLNLTTARAGEGVVHQLCEASGVLDETGQAVQLMANFAILSRSARNLGAFGKIGWIEPSLLEPPREPIDDDMPQEGIDGDVNTVAPPDAATTGDFPCELLFVVRNLKPLDGDEAEGESDDETQHSD